jgi:hypothetical protein
MVLANTPDPVPSVVIESGYIVLGLAFVLQHTPRAVIAFPPSEVILPPDTAPVVVLSVTATVVITGNTNRTGESSLMQEETKNNIIDVTINEEINNILFLTINFKGDFIINVFIAE